MLNQMKVDTIVDAPHVHNLIDQIVSSIHSPGSEDVCESQCAGSAMGARTLLTKTLPWSTMTVSVCLIAPYDLPLTMS